MVNLTELKLVWVTKRQNYDVLTYDNFTNLKFKKSLYSSNLKISGIKQDQ
jgi:hypothetical protein